MTCWHEPWELLTDDGQVFPVVVPGTVTQALPADDERTWVFRTVVAALPEGPVDLVLDGVATAYEVLLDGAVVLSCTSMFTSHRLDVEGLVHKGSLLEIRCLPLRTALSFEKAPRARWRTRLVDDNDLRLIRTTLLGRSPGIAPGPPVIGPYRAVRLETRQPRFEAALDGSDGVLTCSDPAVVLTCGGVSGTSPLRLRDVDLWWPHTHGTPVLHDVLVDGAVVSRVGFRSVVNADPDAFDLVVNGVPVWARGAVWTPPGLLAGVPEDPGATVQAAVDAGMNLLRVPGNGTYESEEFFAACDERGVLVWHDLALSTLDVPHDLLDLDSELAGLLERGSGHPSLAVICGGNETAQQVAMLGLDPDLWRSDFLDVRAPLAVGDKAIWVPNSPYGGGLAIRSGGVAHWFAVGGYRRPLSEARMHPPIFAAESLAFSAGDGSWVPRDNGASWDFADVTDFYASSLQRPRGLVVGEVMASVLGEWRRAASANRGALVLWLRDLQEGAGWGLLDVMGKPRPAWWHLRRVLAPQALWLVDEGLDGLAIHLANDRPEPWTGQLRIGVYRADGLQLEETSVEVTVPARGSWTSGAEQVLGRFTDLTWAYRFGPASAAVVFASFDGRTAVHRVTDVPIVEAAAVELVRDGDWLRLSSVAPVDSVLLSGAPDDNAFWLEPGVVRRIRIGPEPVTVTAANVSGTRQV